MIYVMGTLATVNIIMMISYNHGYHLNFIYCHGHNDAYCNDHSQRHGFHLGVGYDY